MEDRPPFLRRLALDRPEARAWALYDWANSAFWTTIVTAIFPIYFLTVAKGLGEEAAQERFGWATTIAVLCVALLAPVLGALADHAPVKKRLLGLCVVLGAGSTAGLFFVLPGDWLLGLVLFGLANVCVAASVVFYDALLPHVARRGELDRLSASGFALGYLGGGLLLALNLVLVQRPDWFGLPTGDDLDVRAATLPVRLCFLSVAVWWALFSIPLLARVSEPPVEPGRARRASELVFGYFGHLRRSISGLLAYPQAALMLVAFLVYNDGILTVIRMAAIYAKAKGLGEGVLIGTILAIQFVGIPFAFLFGSLAGRFGAKRMILTGLGAYVLIVLVAYQMSSTWEFVLLGILVGMVQGGTQALSRSLFASLIPVAKSGEFFGLYAVGEKFAGLLGPLLFTLAIRAVGSEQAILSVLIFFVLGGALLSRLRVEEGRARVAEEG